ncbi:bacteriocin immunity protein [Aliivibrio fischeri]|uniref:bacteriocin immunity protein n=1 Tax=Aliivibrio fischeri TaxID=668 RepID=UPI003735E543
MELVKNNLSDYTEDEFLSFLEAFWNGEGTEDEEDEFISKFNQIVKHSDKSGLITHPKLPENDSPNGVISEIKTWYADQGIPCFKD